MTRRSGREPCSPQATGAPGAIFYDGLVSSPLPGLYDGKWFEARPAAGLVLRYQLARLGIALDAPQTLPATGAGGRLGQWLVGFGAALALFGGLLRYRRSSCSPAETRGGAGRRGPARRPRHHSSAASPHPAQASVRGPKRPAIKTANSSQRNPRTSARLPGAARAGAPQSSAAILSSSLRSTQSSSEKT